MEIFRKTIDPAPRETGQQTLNPSYRSAAPNFYGTSVTTVTSNDPRLYDTRRNIQTQFSDPPNQVLVNPFLVSSTYGRNPHATRNPADAYAKYSDINTGQVRYYVQEDVKDAVFKPLFTTKATTVAYEYTNPMGTTKPQYVRVPLIVANPASNPDGVPRSTLSFLADTTSQREDILMHQMHKRNSEKWTAKNQ